MKSSLHNRLKAIESRKGSAALPDINIVLVACGCVKDKPELFTEVPYPALDAPDQENKPPHLARLYHFEQRPIESVKKCIDPSNAYGECKCGLPLE